MKPDRQTDAEGSIPPAFAPGGDVEYALCVRMPDETIEDIGGGEALSS